MASAGGSQTQRRRRRTLFLASCLAIGCHAAPPRDEPNGAYLHDARFRRAELIASLVNPRNDYSRMRLEQYAVDGGWDALPEWNPPVQVFGTSDSTVPEALY